MNVLRPTAETWFDQGRDGQINSHEDGTEMERKAAGAAAVVGDDGDDDDH